MISLTDEHIGFVDQADKYAIRGWALKPKSLGEQVAVEIVQGGLSIVAVRACLPTPSLLKALNLEPPAGAAATYGWQIVFPLANGVAPDRPFDVRIVGAGGVLEGGSNLTISTVAGVAPEVLDDFATEHFVFPHYQRADGEILVAVRAFAIGDDIPHLAVEGAAVPLNEPREIDANENRFLNRKCFVRRFTVRADGESEAVIGISPRAGRASDLVRTLHVPAEAFGAAAPGRPPIPDLANIRRVSGHNADELSYVVGGWTTYRHLDILSRSYLGRAISEWPRVLDWGVGCARLLRYFLDSGQHLVGADIDAVNVEWCQQHLGARAQIHLLSTTEAVLPLDDDSIDMLYGISVVTHLSEHQHHRWLQEIKRVVRPGGMIVLTTHGEFALFRAPNSIALPMVEKFGFFDGVPDFALGKDLSSYYRTTYHSRRYIVENWSAYFDIFAVVPGGNAFLQDYVVMRAR